MKKTISDWMREVHETSKSKGWHDGDQATFVEKIMLVVTECAEVVEEYRANKKINEIYFTPKGPQGIPIELADVVIRVFDTCEKYGIDLEDAIHKKNEHNKTRDKKHGGKKI